MIATMAMPFSPPSVSEVQEYAVSIGHPEFNADRFVSFYEMTGWLVAGKTRMKSWQAAVRYWLTNDRDRKRDQPASLGALQIALERVEEEIRQIIYPGGAAYKTVPTGDKRIRYEYLMKQRAVLKAKIEAFGV